MPVTPASRPAVAHAERGHGVPFRACERKTEVGDQISAPHNGMGAKVGISTRVLEDQWCARGNYVQGYRMLQGHRAGLTEPLGKSDRAEKRAHVSAMRTMAAIGALSASAATSTRRS